MPGRATVSLDAPLSDEDGSRVGDVIPDDSATSPMDALASREEALRGKLDKLRVENKAAEGEGLKLQFLLRDLERADQVYDRIQQNLNQLEYQAGGGLRYLTILGPIRLDVGSRLGSVDAPRPDPGSRWAFHFSIGEAF